MEHSVHFQCFDDAADEDDDDDDDDAVEATVRTVVGLAATTTSDSATASDTFVARGFPAGVMGSAATTADTAVPAMLPFFTALIDSLPRPTLSTMCGQSIATTPHASKYYLAFWVLCFCSFSGGGYSVAKGFRDKVGCRSGTKTALPTAACCCCCCWYAGSLMKPRRDDAMLRLSRVVAFSTRAHTFVRMFFFLSFLFSQAHQQQL